MVTDLDEFELFRQDKGDYQSLKAIGWFRNLTPEARARLRAKWIKEGRIIRNEDTGEDSVRTWP